MIVTITPRASRHATLNGAAAVVGLRFVGPAHAVAPLPLGGLADMRQAQVLLPDAHQVRRQDDAAGVAGPVQRIERRVVFRQVRIAAVAENALHEIEVADQAAGREKPDFHGLFRVAARRRTDQRPQQQRDEAAGLVRLIGGEGQGQQIGRRVERRAPQRREGLLGHRRFVRRNGKAALGDVKQSLRGAPVAARIVQHALRHAIRVQRRATRKNPRLTGRDKTRAMPSRSSTKVLAGSRAAPCGQTSLR